MYLNLLYVVAQSAGSSFYLAFLGNQVFPGVGYFIRAMDPMSGWAKPSHIVLSIPE